MVKNVQIPNGYKQTEVGIIPSDWEICTLDYFAEIIMGQSPIGSSYNQHEMGVPLINGPTEFTERYPIKIQWTTLPTKYCREKDILICIRGSSTGRINISNNLYCIGRGVAAIRAKSNSNNIFLEYILHYAVKSILKLTSGSTFPNIDTKSLKSIKNALPSLPEQQAIAEVLGDVDALITALDALIVKKRQIKQGAMQQLLTGQRHGPPPVRMLTGRRRGMKRRRARGTGAGGARRIAACRRSRRWRTWPSRSRMATEAAGSSSTASPWPSARAPRWASSASPGAARP